MQLSQVPWLEALPSTALSALEARTVRRRLARGQLLFDEGDRFDAVALVLAGRLDLSRRVQGRLMLLRAVRPGESVGASLVAGAAASAAARAGTSETRVLLVPGAELRAAFARHPPAAIAALAALARLIDALTEELAEARTLGLEERVRRAVLRLGAGSREIRLTQQQLADAVGASRERVNRALGRLEAQGLLHRRRGRLELP
ncbi:MAG: Crp/Fnr family transcriptional regulator [Myxococcota bacterium]